MAIIRKMPMDEYHDSPALSNSKLKVYRQHGPDHFHRRYIAKNLADDDSKALLIGRAFDCLVFDGQEAFDAAYAVKPEGMSFATTKGKDWRDAHAGLDILAHEDFELFAEMHAAIIDHRLAAQLMSKGEAQVTIRRELPGLGLEVQARPDWFSTEACALTTGPYLVDLKTTTDLSTFDRQCVQMGYHYQTVLAQFLLAREGIQADAFLMVVEKKRAPRVRIKRIPEAILAAGWDALKADIANVADRYRRDSWTDEQSEIEDVEVPMWQQRQLAMASEA